MQKTASKILILVLLLSVYAAGKAQSGNANNKDEAVWIKMIDDPNVNYYAAVKAYEDYWKTHEKPADPEDRLGDNNPSEKNEAFSDYCLVCIKYINYII